METLKNNSRAVVPMDGIINLLKEKNHYLKKFYTLNKAELFRLTDGDFSRLDTFYQSRETILDMITHVEQSIEKKLGIALKPETALESEKQIIRRELSSKDELVAQILDQDLKILAIIESEKSDIIKKLQDVRKSRSLIGAYHSGPEPKRLRTVK